MTIDQALARARSLGVDRLDAQLLLSHLLDQPRSWVIAHGDATLDPAQALAFDADCARRADDWPLAYLTGRREFHGLPLEVTPAVLVPRPDTETLVDWAIELLSSGDDPMPHRERRAAPEFLDPHGGRAGPWPGPGGAQLIDLGTGSGAVALALAHARPDARLTATDLDPQALAVASANADRLGLAVEFALGSWWDAVPAGRRFRLAVSNPPYIAAGDRHLDALRHEPRGALVAGVDGLDAIRAIVAGAPQHLSGKAWLLLEHGFDQAGQVAALMERHGFVDISTRRDIEGRGRCTGGRLHEYACP